MKPAALLLALALSTPVLAQSPKIELPYTQFTLPNGLRVILHEDHKVPIVTVNMWYHVGSARERPGRTGFAHLFEHLMFMGSGHVKPGEFDSWLESAGSHNKRYRQQALRKYCVSFQANRLELSAVVEV